MFSQACVILFTISLMATGSLLILVMAQSVASYCNAFLFGILFGENCMDLKKNGLRGRMSFATVNLSFEQKLSVRNCYQSPQPDKKLLLSIIRCLSVHRERSVCPIACWDTHPPGPEADTSRDQTPPRTDTPQQTPPGNKRAVRFLLECILVCVIKIQQSSLKHNILYIKR